MASDFLPDRTPVLNYRPRSPVRYRDRSQLYILWPTYAYRVLAPQPFNSVANPFQRAVLGFFHMGVTRPEQISSELRLHPDLIVLIEGELVGMGLLGRDHALTQKGYQALVDDEVYPEIITGYVFQDPWSRRLWPRFVDRLNYQPVRFEHSSEYPKLEFGTKGDPRIMSAFFKRVGAGSFPVTPTVSDVIEACHRHRQQIKRSGALQTEEEDDSSPGDHAFTPEIKRVEIISEDPDPFFLVTYIFFPENEDPRQGWQVCDPFGLGISRSLYRAIMDARQTDHELDRRISDLEDRFNSDDEAGYWELQKQDAEAEIVRRLPEARDLPFYTELVNMEIAFQATDDRKDPKDFFWRAGILLEGCLAFVEENYPIQDSWQVFQVQERGFRAELLNELARQYSFATPLPPRYASISPRKIRLAATTRRGTIGERLVLLLLSVRLHQNHPLRFVASKMPDMFHMIEEINSSRDRSAHYTQDFDQNNDLAEYRDIILSIVSLFVHQYHAPSGGC